MAWTVIKNLTSLVSQMHTLTLNSFFHFQNVFDCLPHISPSFLGQTPAIRFSGIRLRQGSLGSSPKFSLKNYLTGLCYRAATPIVRDGSNSHESDSHHYLSREGWTSRNTASERAPTCAFWGNGFSTQPLLSWTQTSQCRPSIEAFKFFQW